MIEKHKRKVNIAAGYSKVMIEVFQVKISNNSMQIPKSPCRGGVLDEHAARGISCTDIITYPHITTKIFGSDIPARVMSVARLAQSDQSQIKATQNTK